MAGRDKDLATRVGQAYLDHLTRDDRMLLTSAVQLTGERSVPADRMLAARPWIVEDVLGDARSFAAIFGERRESLLQASPFCMFAVCIQRARLDLAGRNFVDEWVGARRRLPVLGADALRTWLDEPVRRLFLTELLASYTHVASGAVYVETRRGFRRLRFSELDPVRLAGLLDIVDADERPGIYRRLGDVSLFLTGVFPDHIAEHGFAPVAESRLWRAARAPGNSRSSDVAEQLGPVGFLEQLGARWYRLAADTLAAPLTATMTVVHELARDFPSGRRVLNFISDRYLYRHRTDWFGTPTT
ncbi:MAG TPA: hypothetical protein VEZ15_18195 [Acidimicrobiia bacterium]|nr:hypothetical protein [Acidimicrobiia bacterium]